MRPNPLQRRRWAPTAQRPRFRPLIELLETRVVPSIVDHSGGFASHSDLTFNGSAVVNGSVAELTTGANQAGSFFTNNQVEDFLFNINFTFQTTGATTATGGFTLTFTRDPAGPNALGGSGAGLGFSGLQNSLAIFFEPSTNSTGLLVSGQGPTTVSLQGTGINLQSQDVFSVTLTNNESTIAETIVDTSTGASFTTSYNVAVSPLIGGHEAFVGFTGGTGAHGMTEEIQTFVGFFGSSVSPPLTASGVGTINGVEGQLLHNVAVATFTGPSSSTGVMAVINWGDGTTSTGSITGPDQNGVFTVSGSHSYVEEGDPAHGGPFVITVTITSGTSTATVTDTTNIAEAPIVATGGFLINAVETQSFTATVATFTDTGGPENATLDYSATIDWGDGTTSIGTISGPDQNGVFTVTGTHAYADLDQNQSGFADIFPITVTITHETVSATAVSTALVAEEPEPPPVLVGGFTISAVEGQTFTAAVATFTNGNEPATQFTATINWGDGTTSQGTIVGPDQNGVFTIIGSHAYAEESNDVHGGNPFIISVTLTNETSTTVFDQAFVAEAPIIATGGNTISAVEGQTFAATVATFTDTGGPENATLDYTASIDWGDGTTSTGTISGPDQNGVFTVTGTHAYAEESDVFHGGPPTITVTITHETVSAVVTDTANVAEAPISASGGLTVSAVEGQAFTATVATFTDTGGPENATLDYTASIDWGDGTTSTGTISGPDQNGVFTVTGTHAYAEESDVFHGGPPTITVTITHETVSAVVTDTANVAEAPLSVTPGPTVFATAGQDVTAAVATFVDTGVPEDPTLDYTATIDWGDGTTTTGIISGPDQNGVFTVTGDHTYTSDGTFTINVAIFHESAGEFDTSTSAVVTGPFGGAASLPGQGLLTGPNFLLAPPAQQVTAVPVMIAQAPSSTASSTSGSDLYWSQYSSRGDQLGDLNAWAIDSLAQALQGSPS
jgi:hypothetical protein